MLNLFQAALTAMLTRFFINSDRYADFEEREEKEVIKKDKGTTVFRKWDVPVYIDPPKSVHYVNVEENENVYIITLSKRPISPEAERCDYLWDAEDICEAFAQVYRAYGTVIIKRDVPMKIADDDLACPYCRNSRPPLNWDNYTKEQKGVTGDAPCISSAEPRAVHELHRTYYWCPICCRTVWGSNLLRKGEEWKRRFFKEQPSPIETSVRNITGNSEQSL